jgi:acylphosphatase
MSRDGETAQAHIVVRGRVQGVYFRGSLKQEADTQRVVGWVRNQDDGSVEAMLQGRRVAVSAVVAWMREGPRGARVESADVDWSEIDEPLQGFEIVS